jgi:hypothetical protein
VKLGVVSKGVGFGRGKKFGNFGVGARRRIAYGEDTTQRLNTETKNEC